MGKFGLDLPGIFLCAQFMDEDLDPRLVLVVAPPVAVVDPEAGLAIGDELVERHEVADQRCDHRRAAHAAADIELRAQRASRVLHQPDADIVQPHRGAVGLGGDHRHLELARQGRELGMEARPLADQLGIGTRVDDFIGGGPGELVAGGIADAIAAGLDRVHLDAGQLGQQVGRFLQLDPVVLDVLAGGEMARAAVIALGDVGQLVHLGGVQRPVGNRYPQHVGVQLQVEPVHQPQRAERLLRQVALEPAAGLVAEFLDAGIDHRLVVLIILVHQITHSPAAGSAGFNVRSGRTVGPSARIRSLMWAGRTPAASRLASIR